MKATLSEWKAFIDSSVYADMIEDTGGRKEILTNKLIAGNDPCFSDDSLRGRIDELSYISSMASDIVSLIEIEKNKKHTEKILHKLDGNP